MEIITLWPLAQSEIHSSRGNLIDALIAAHPPQIDDASVGRDAFVDIVAAGGYPQARNRSGRRRDLWFRDYVDITVDRDLRDISDAFKLNEMPRLLRLLASQLLAHLLGADAARIRTDDQVTGKALENFVAMEIVKLAQWADTDVRPYHYRDGRDEIDIVLETRADDLVAIEVTASATLDVASRRALTKLRDAAGDRPLAWWGNFRADRPAARVVLVDLAVIHVCPPTDQFRTTI